MNLNQSKKVIVENGSNHIEQNDPGSMTESQISSSRSSS